MCVRKIWKTHHLRLLMNQLDRRMLQGAGVDLMGISSKWGQQTSALDGSNSEIYAAKQIAKGAGPEGSMRCNDGSSIEKSRCIRKYFKQVGREQPQLFSRFSWPKQNNQSHQFLAIQQLFIVFVWARTSFPIRFDQLMLLLTRISHLSKPPSSLSTKIHATIAHIVQDSYCLHASPGPTVWMLGWRSSGREIGFTGGVPMLVQILSPQLKLINRGPFANALLKKSTISFSQARFMWWQPKRSAIVKRRPWMALSANGFYPSLSSCILYYLPSELFKWSSLHRNTHPRSCPPSLGIGFFHKNVNCQYAWSEETMWGLGLASCL